MYAPTGELLSSLAVSPLLFIGQTTLLLAIPLAAGMLVAARYPAIAAKIRRKTTLAGSAVLGGTIIYGIVYFYPLLWPAVGLLAGFFHALFNFLPHFCHDFFNPRGVNSAVFYQPFQGNLCDLSSDGIEA